MKNEQQTVENYIKVFAPLVKQFIAQEIGAAEARFDAKFKELEKRKSTNLADAYQGVWRKGNYECGELVTRSGSLWLCLQATEGTPGNTSAWRLIVKKGKDGKSNQTEELA